MKITNPFPSFNNYFRRDIISESEYKERCTDEQNKKAELRRKIEDIKAQDELEKQCNIERYLEDL